MQTKVKPFEDNFGHRFFARCESVNFRLQAPIDGDKGPLGQVGYFLNNSNNISLLINHCLLGWTVFYNLGVVRLETE